MLEMGATDWNAGLRGACLGGHMNFAQLMIEKGAQNWQEGLEHAYAADHKELGDLMITMGASPAESDWAQECVCLMLLAMMKRVS